MKTLYHLCFTSKHEVCCRDSKDYKTMISRIGQAAVRNNADVWAFAVMSNHVHLVVQCDCPRKFIKTLRSSYTQSFNRRYFRDGKLGEEGFFQIELHGTQHIIDALTYVMQNPWHHKIVSNPFAYQYSSMALYFKDTDNILCNNVGGIEKEPPKCKRLLSKYIRPPKGLSYDVFGMVQPISFIEVNLVENIFGSYNAFQFMTHRKNYAEWKNAQLSEAEDMPIINLRSIEPLLGSEDIHRIENGGNRWIKERGLTDMDICRMVDEYYVPRLKKRSYAELTFCERERIMKNILEKNPHRTSKSQVLRCISRV